MAHRNRHLAVFVLFLGGIFSSSLFGQAPAVPKPFTVASHGGTPVGLMLETTQGKTEKIDFRPGERSREYSASGPLVFFTVTQPAAANMAPVRNRVAQAIIPEGTKRALLLFVPNNSSETAADLYRVLVLEDALDTFPASTVRFINASGMQLAGLIAQSQVTFGAGISAPYPAGNGLRVQLAMSSRDRFFPSFDQEFLVEPTQRLICILLPPESSNSPLVRWAYISDYIAPPAKSAAR